MSGHGPFLWCAYGAALLALVAEALLVARRRRAALHAAANELSN
jgi:heme exporter protein CcmD